MLENSFSPQPNASEPVSFRSAVDHFATSAAGNATAQALIQFKGEPKQLPRFGGDAFRDLIQAECTLTDPENPIQRIQEQLVSLLGHRDYIPLTRSTRQSGVALALYAGDGIVAKVTAESFLQHKLRPTEGLALTLPKVLAPIITRKIDDYYIELFPWIDQADIVRADVQKMNEQLESMGLCFKRGDGRGDNIGKMPDGTLAVLDGDAVTLSERKTTPESRQDLKDDFMSNKLRWLEQLINNFPGLYVNSDSSAKSRLAGFLSSPADYSLRFPKKM